MPARPPVCLSIAGSDSGGGAGIQADLKAFARCGTHGATALTALTAQSTVGVDGVHAVPGEFIVEQVRSVCEDIGVDAVKVGMLGDEATILAVERSLGLVGGAPAVVDPVMVAESGGTLLDDGAERLLAERILPLARVVTPNVHEARRLAVVAGLEPARAAEASQRELAAGIRELGVAAALVTGGHVEGGVDLLDDGGSVIEIRGEVHSGRSAHGSGCTHSSALAAFLASGLELAEAARWARRIASAAVGGSLEQLGAGAGPVDALGLDRIAAGALGPSPSLA